MKIAVAPQDVSVHGNFKTSDFNVGDVAFIVDMFADKVYSHKERAVIRELACNAYDSHVMAGTKDIPFNVHLPTCLEPWFSVRDFGTGLSDDDVRNIFAGIGISTKRNNNDVIGCFGIGSLSPYSIADSFTVVSYYNGIVRTYTCYRDEQRKPVVALLSEESTEEANGLEVSVSVPSTQISEFDDEAEYVFRFWEGTFPNINNVLVNSRCEQQRNRFTFKDEDFGLSPSYGEMYAIMGNIAYKIPYELDEFRCVGYIKFNLGELEFDTARENLSMTDKVRAAIKAKFKQIKARLIDIATKQIEAQETDYDKAVLADKLSRGSIGNLMHGFDFKKYALPNAKDSFDYFQAKHRGVDKHHSKHVPVGDCVEYYLYKDRMSARIRQYLKEKNSGYTIVLFKDVQQAQECKIPLNLLNDLNDLPKVEYTRNYTYSKVKTFKFKKYSYKNEDCWQEHELEIGEDEIVYVALSRWSPVSNSVISSSNDNIESTLECLVSCKIAKPTVIGLKTSFFSSKDFKNGNFISLDNYVRREFSAIAKNRLTHYVYNNKKMDLLRDINKCILSEELKSIVELADSCVNDEIIGVCQRLQIKVDINQDNTIDDLMNKFMDKYKMLNFVDCYEVSRKRDIIAEYICGKVK